MVTVRMTLCSENNRVQYYSKWHALWIVSVKTPADTYADIIY